MSCSTDSSVALLNLPLELYLQKAVVFDVCFLIFYFAKFCYYNLKSFEDASSLLDFSDHR